MGLTMAMVCIFAGAMAAAQSPTSPTMIVGAMDFEGLPLGNVQFRVSIADEFHSEGHTDETGVLSVELPRENETIKVELIDSRYQAMPAVRLSDGPPHRVPFVLFHARVEDMSYLERLAFARLWPEVLAAQAEELLATNDVATTESASLPVPPSPVLVAAFLEGTRREDSVPLAAREDPETTAVLSARVVDAYGSPVDGQIVHLFAYDADLGRVRLAGYERTDERGIAVFEDLEPGRYYRAEAEARDGRLARSSLIMAELYETHLLPAMVLRQPGEQLSGVIFSGNSPADETIVQTVAIGRTPALTTTTDQMGYFTLAPLSGEEVRVRILRMTPEGPRGATLRLEPGRTEHLVPFDIVALPIER